MYTMLSGHTTQNDNDSKNRQYSSVEEERCRFVGDVDLPESKRYDFHLSCTTTLTVCRDLEPLLVESSRRFVLFPIQYPDVS